MQYLDLTLPTPEENIALDQSLLDAAENQREPEETLRFWESPVPAVIVGRSSRITAEVRLEVCRRDGVPILRRSSGGAAVVIGPGCLIYTLVLNLTLRPALRAVDAAHRYVLGRMIDAMRPLLPEIQCRGTSDLVLGTRKFSGNSLRLKRKNLLYHGTILYNFPLEWIDRYLTMPPREPDYRQGRTHEEFVTNIPVGASELREAIRAVWEDLGGPPLPQCPSPE